MKLAPTFRTLGAATRLLSSYSSSFRPHLSSPFSESPFQDIPTTSPIQRNISGNVVITGGNRGIGFSLVSTLLSKRPDTRIFAGVRDPNSSNLLEFKGDSRLTTLPLDLSSEESIESFANAVCENEAVQKIGINYIFNVAGILNDDGMSGGRGGPERSVLAIDGGWMQKTLQINTIAPFLLIKNLAPSLQRPVPKRGDEGGAFPAPVIMNVSARVGSISDNNGLGGWYSYRASKSALNQLTRTLAIEQARGGRWKRGGISVSFPPGTTETGLSEPFSKPLKNTSKLFPPHFVSGQMMDLAEKLTEENSGGLYAWDHKAIPF